MHHILGTLTGRLVGVLPLIVLVLFCIGGYLITKRGGRATFDSPWFWAFAFSTVGLLGVWAISGKYDDRQKRLEARYEARERIAEQARRAVQDSKHYDADDSAAGLQSGYSQERQVPLRFLAMALLVVSAVSGFMFWRNKQVPARQHS
jgi:hypothetical protein